jgi:hypothetical protein
LAVVVVLIGLPAIVSLMRVERVPLSHERRIARLRTARDWARGEVIRYPILYILAGTLAPAFIGTVIFFQQF